MGSFAFGPHRLPSVLTMGVPSALLIAGSVFTERGGRLPRFAQRMSFLGDSSYSLYLTHWLLLGILPKGIFMVLSNPVYFLPFCLIYTLLSIVIGIILYEIVERRLVGSLQVMAKNIRKKRAACANVSL